MTSRKMFKDEDFQLPGRDGAEDYDEMSYA